MKLAVCILLLAATTQLHAQSRHPWSLQGSAEYVVSRKDYGEALPSGATLGWEAQLRYTFSRLSVGAGYQQSTVFRSATADLTGTLSIAFLEPRLVVTVIGERVAPYLVARVGYGALQIRPVPRVTEQSITYGGGAGVMLALSSRFALDAGVQYFVADFGNGGGHAGYYLLRVGLAVGLF